MPVYRVSPKATSYIRTIDNDAYFKTELFNLCGAFLLPRTPVALGLEVKKHQCLEKRQICFFFNREPERIDHDDFKDSNLIN